LDYPFENWTTHLKIGLPIAYPFAKSDYPLPTHLPKVTTHLPKVTTHRITHCKK